MNVPEGAWRSPPHAEGKTKQKLENFQFDPVRNVLKTKAFFFIAPLDKIIALIYHWKYVRTLSDI